MSSEGSVSRWVTALKAGDTAAAQPLWERYHRRLVALARQKLRPASRRAADEDDVVQSAFHSFFQGVARGRFPQLNDRDNLWRLLVVITARKALDQLAHERSKRQGGGTVGGEPRISPGGAAWDEAALEQVVGAEPSPEFAAQVAEQYRRLLDLLGDETLRQVAVWKMEGCTNDEVAGRLDCSRRTVARKLETIRIIWSQEPP
ncbi:MAG TPA: ECF-type sigma factor [Gemmataceae bacterium]|jgi:RNA polymerase sigma factor (sigma-70 family)|nr:ECF-type sigma factor [Gemmataceae bacterium]